jgi:hypothetical protein
MQTYDLEDWGAENPEALPGSQLDDDIAYVGEYLYTRAAFIAQSSGYGYFDPDNPDEPSQQFGKLWLYLLANPGEDVGVTDDTLTIRCWPFSLDDHDFGVFRLGPSSTLVFDLKTRQWSHWASPNRDNWRAHIGTNWVGMTETLGNFATDVVAGDDVTGTLWIVDPTYGQDDNTDTGALPFTRMVIGGLALDGRDTAPCGAVQLTASLGNPALTGSAITLRTSDDLGHSYANHGSVTIAAGSFDQVVEWRSLGLMRQPGRIFELSDNGIARIGRLSLR